jgi:hypothetical protein
VLADIQSPTSGTRRQRLRHDKSNGTVIGGQSCADGFEVTVDFIAALGVAINALLTISGHHWTVLLDTVCAT